MVRITPEIKNRMIEMRSNGATYSEIFSVLGVTKERCIAYLKDIPISGKSISAIEKDWQIAENEARDVLSHMGFIYIHNLNSLCSFPPSWDYLARKSDQWWLIDVTVSGQKSIAAKRDAMVDGYEHAILLKQSDKSWKLIQIAMQTINSYKAE